MNKLYIQYSDQYSNQLLHRLVLHRLCIFFLLPYSITGSNVVTFHRSNVKSFPATKKSPAKTFFHRLFFFLLKMFFHMVWHRYKIHPFFSLKKTGYTYNLLLLLLRQYIHHHNITFDTGVTFNVKHIDTFAQVISRQVTFTLQTSHDIFTF